MSSFIYMKILESQPDRYDRGITILSLGAADRVVEQLMRDAVRPGDAVLDIGCGTGRAAILAGGRGAHVVGFDISPGMLSVARREIDAAGLSKSIELREMGISGMDTLGSEKFDVVSSTLVFSELSADEQAFTLSHAFRVLKPGGRLVLADEVRPDGVLRRLAHAVVRLPLLVVTYVLTQTTTRAVMGLPERIEAAGFTVVTARRYALGSFLAVVAVKRAPA